MARPFRLRPPETPPGVLARPRLLSALASRWSHRLVTVVAGPGFGKTTVLVSAVADPRRPEDAVDLWLACEPADESGDHLLAGLAEAAGIPGVTEVDAIVERVWARAPAEVCFVLDDVHEVPSGSTGAEVLSRLLSDLPRNGHLVLASRVAVPVPTARLAAGGQLVRVDESAMVLDPDELEAFAVARGSPPELLASTGGWPALAELTATAGTDLVLDYLWEEVLARAGSERAELLARLSVVGGADDEVLTAVAGHPAHAAELVAGIPLVERSEQGWVRLHPLWAPALQRLLEPSSIADARRRAAAVHRRCGRYSAAADLLAEACAWDDLLAILRDAVVVSPGAVDPTESGRIRRMLPSEVRSAPEALLADGMARRAVAPLDAVPTLAAAAQGFREQGDVDGELVAIAAQGLVCWWHADMDGLVPLIVRVEELAAAGWRRARALIGIGQAAVADLAADSEAVLAHLADIDDELAGLWAPTVRWLRTVAHRREGRLQRAYDEIDSAPPVDFESQVAQLRLSRLRLDWLRGDVDSARERFERAIPRSPADSERFLAREVMLEAASKAAWLGDVEPARRLLAAVDDLALEQEGPLATTLRSIAAAAAAVVDGDEVAAAAILCDHARATVGHPHGLYWQDRAAVGLVHVLVPETRAVWAGTRLPPALAAGLDLAEALEAARAGDLSVVRAMAWPPVGVVRAHLPAPWAVELGLAGTAAGNPPPEGLLDAVGDVLRPTVRRIAGRAVGPVAAEAKRHLAALPAVPDFRLHIAVIGPLEVTRDGEPLAAAELRRPRVRELLSHVVAHTPVRREAVAAALWPDLDDGGRNLRVTLSYLQRALQPDREEATQPYFLRSEGPWLTLTGDQLTVDVWQLDAHLDDAAAAERARTPGVALAAYRAVLPLWRGEPYAEVPDAPWVVAERARLQQRYTAAAVRAGELLLASGDAGGARDAAEHALRACVDSEAAYRVLVRTHLAEGDLAAARRAMDACRAALADLDLEPEAATANLLEHA